MNVINLKTLNVVVLYTDILTELMIVVDGIF